VGRTVRSIGASDKKLKTERDRKVDSHDVITTMAGTDKPKGGMFHSENPK